jgi:hypothetical protein
MPDNRWIRLGGVAGIGYVLVVIIAALIPGAPPEADGKATTYQNYLVEHQSLVVQAWMYALAAPLLLMFAVSVRRILHRAGDGGYLGDLFLVGNIAIASLLVAAMAMQAVVTQRAEGLAPEVTYTFGVHFVGVLIGFFGFMMAATAFAYAFCVITSGVLPRWTAYLAILSLIVSLVATAGVFSRAGPFCLEGGFSAWAPAVSNVVWYVGTSIALLRTSAEADASTKAV